VAACKRRSDAEEDECESETRADSGVLPVEAGGDDLWLADRPGLRADELDLVAWRSVRGRAKVEILQGSDRLLVWGDDEANRTRCGNYGSLLYSVVRDGAYVHVAMGSLVDESAIRPTEHIFVGSKAHWFEITDDLPRSDEY
jgi:hypothetical protein